MKSIKKISRQKLHELIDQLPEGKTREAGLVYEFTEALIKKPKPKKTLSEICQEPFIFTDKVEMPSRDERNER